MGQNHVPWTLYTNSVLKKSHGSFSILKFKALQQRGRRVRIQVQEKVENEIWSLIDQGPIVRLEECSDQQFISPIVITVKKDQSKKLAMDSKQIIKSIHKSKYQMPNIEFC